MLCVCTHSVAELDAVGTAEVFVDAVDGSVAGGATEGAGVNKEPVSLSCASIQIIQQQANTNIR